MKKGIVLSLVTVLLFTLLVQYATNIQVAKSNIVSAMSRLFLAEKIGYYVDDVASDLRNIVAVDTPANSTTIIFVENMTINKTAFFSTYPSFVANYSTRTNTNFSFNMPAPFEIIFSNGLAYQSDYSNRLIKIFNSTGANALVTMYKIDVRSTTTRGAVTNPTFVASGTYMVVNYTDPVPAKSFYTAGYVDPSVTNTMTIRLPSALMKTQITAGLIDGKNNSFMFNQSDDSFPSVTISVNRTTKDSVSAVYNASLNITTTIGNFSGLVPAN